MNRKNRRAARQKSGPRKAAPYPAAIGALLEDAVKHHRAGDLAAAAAGYRRVLERQHDNPDALNLLGLMHYQQGEPQPALELIARAAEIVPDHPFYQNNIGIVLRELGRDDKALPCFRRAIALDAAYLDPRINLAKALHHLGRIDEAIAACRAALEQAPRTAEAHSVLALALKDAGNDVAAMEHFRQAAALDPANAIYRLNLGNHLYTMDDIDAAIEALRAAVRLDPRFVDAHSQLGAALRNADRPNDAIASLTTAIRLDPNHVSSWMRLAAAYKDMRQTDRALDAIREAIRLAPSSVEAYDQLGAILLQADRHEEAIAAYDTATRLDPDHPFAAANRALVYLPLGRFAEGWRDYRGRVSILRTRDRLFQDRLPDDLSGKRILLVHDQGLGDQIFFLRFAPGLKDRHARLDYLSEDKLRGILARVPCFDDVLGDADEDSLPAADYRISIGDLPYVSGMAGRTDIPPPLPLPARQDLVARSREALGAFGPPPYIGVTWRAGIQRHHLLSKVAPLEAVAQALRQIPGTPVALQRQPEAGELDRFAEALGRPVCDMTALNEDLEAMLALLGELDDYVCVSNTNVHLRAGRARTCRVLVPYPAEYRWMNEGTESPWFPGTRIYRESRSEGWAPALAALSSDLAASWPAQS